MLSLAGHKNWAGGEGGDFLEGERQNVQSRSCSELWKMHSLGPSPLPLHFLSVKWEQYNYPPHGMAENQMRSQLWKYFVNSEL